MPEVPNGLPVPQLEYEARWDSVRAEMSNRGYDTLVVWQRSGGSYDRAGDVWYLANYATHASGQEPPMNPKLDGRSFAALIFTQGNPPELHTVEPIATIDPDTVAVREIHSHSESLIAGLCSRLEELGATDHVAYVGDSLLPANMYRRLTDATPSLQWVPEDAFLCDIQRRKSDNERDIYRRAGDLSSRALTLFMEALAAGQSQSIAASRAAEVIVAAGGGFQRIACNTGPRSTESMWNYPMYGYRDTTPNHGDMFRAWLYGPILEGYWIDPGRTGVVGNSPTPAQRRLIEDNVDMTVELVRSVRAGVTPRQVGELGDKLSREAGYSYDTGGGIWDIYGHGLGTFWAPPFLPAQGADISGDPDSVAWDLDAAFIEGEIFTIETFQAVEDVGMAGCEEVFIVTNGEPENLITTPLLLWDR